MKQKEREKYLINYLLKEREQTIENISYSFDLYRSLVNLREALPISEEYLKVEDEYLQNKVRQITDITTFDKQVNIWKGDITTLKIDAIVNAANEQMVGCFIPCHHCIDNAIHTYAGVRLRLKCSKIMKEQGNLEPIGKAKITNGYNLLSQYVIHTVGPIVHGELLEEHSRLLKSCYESILTLAYQHHCQSIALCSISTGVFCFPKIEAAKIAIETVKEFIETYNIKIIFSVFSEEDYDIYHQLWYENNNQE